MSQDQLKRTRAAYACGCMGEKWYGPQEDRFIGGQIRDHQRATGRELGQCPYKALYSPLVAEVIKLYKASSNGWGAHPASVADLCSSHRAWEGLLFFSDMLAKVKAHNREKEKAAKSSPGAVGVGVTNKGVIRG